MLTRIAIIFLIFSSAQAIPAERFKSAKVNDGELLLHCRSYHHIFYVRFLTLGNDANALNDFLKKKGSCGYLPRGTNFDRRPSGFPDGVDMLLLEDGTVTWTLGRD